MYINVCMSIPNSQFIPPHPPPPPVFVHLTLFLFIMSFLMSCFYFLLFSTAKLPYGPISYTLKMLMAKMCTMKVPRTPKTPWNLPWTGQGLIVPKFISSESAVGWRHSEPWWAQTSMWPPSLLLASHWNKSEKGEKIAWLGNQATENFKPLFWTFSIGILFEGFY